MLTLFLEWGKGAWKLSLSALNRLRRPFRHQEAVFEVKLKHRPYSLEGTRYGRSEIEVLEVSARSVRGATTKALKLHESRLSLSGPFLKRGTPEIVSVLPKTATEKKRGEKK
jgi:hypothetical protein